MSVHANEGRKHWSWFQHLVLGANTIVIGLGMLAAEPEQAPFFLPLALGLAALWFGRRWGFWVLVWYTLALALLVALAGGLKEIGGLAQGVTEEQWREVWLDLLVAIARTAFGLLILFAVIANRWKDLPFKRPALKHRACRRVSELFYLPA